MPNLWEELKDGWEQIKEELVAARTSGDNPTAEGGLAILGGSTLGAAGGIMAATALGGPVGFFIGLGCWAGGALGTKHFVEKVENSLNPTNVERLSETAREAREISQQLRECRSQLAELGRLLDATIERWQASRQRERALIMQLEQAVGENGRLSSLNEELCTRLESTTTERDTLLEDIRSLRQDVAIQRNEVERITSHSVTLSPVSVVGIFRNTADQGQDQRASRGASSASTFNRS